MILVYQQVKKKKISEKESIFWMIGSMGMLILGIFPEIIILLSNMLHIEYAPSLLFLVGIVFLLGLVFRLTTHISILKEQTKELAQITAILQKRISEIEDKK